MSHSWEEIAEIKTNEIRRLHSVCRAKDNLIERKNNQLFQTTSLIRTQKHDELRNWPETDEWFYKNFDITKEEMDEICFGKDDLLMEQDETEQSEEISANDDGMAMT